MTGTYDPATNQTLWGTGNPVPMFDPFYRPGDNLFTNSVISYDPDTGNMNWYFQFTPGDMWDYDEVGTHILIDGQVAGQLRKLITHSARNGFLYTMERANGRHDAREALRGGELDQGHRPEDRQAARLRSRPRTSRPTQASAISCRASRSRRCARRRPAATTTGRHPTARRQNSSTSRRCRTASPLRSTARSTTRSAAGTAA